MTISIGEKSRYRTVHIKKLIIELLVGYGIIRIFFLLYLHTRAHTKAHHCKIFNTNDKNKKRGLPEIYGGRI